MNLLIKPIQAAGALSLILATSPLTAQEEKPRSERLTSTAEMFAIVEAGLPEILSEDNSKLLQQLLSPKLGEPLQENFNADRAIKTLFTSGEPSVSKCDDNGRMCEFSQGEAEGEGEYRKLAVSEDAGSMSVRYAYRTPINETVSPTSLSDKDAYAMAAKLLIDTLGVPSEEIPQAPSNARNPLPVKTVNLAYSNGEGEQVALPVEKLVKVQRGLYIGGDLGWIPGPGKLAVALNDDSISVATVRDWADMGRYGEGLDPNQAKSRSQLAEELVRRFEKEGIARLSSARSLLAVSLLEGADLPVPVLRVFASPQARDLSEASQASVVSSAGVIIEVPLIAMENDDLSQERSE